MKATILLIAAALLAGCASAPGNSSGMALASASASEGGGGDTCLWKKPRCRVR